jgi:hypothetical protein
MLFTFLTTAQDKFIISANLDDGLSADTDHPHSLTELVCARPTV